MQGIRCTMHVSTKEHITGTPTSLYHKLIPLYNRHHKKCTTLNRCGKIYVLIIYLEKLSIQFALLKTLSNCKSLLRVQRYFMKGSLTVYRKIFDTRSYGGDALASSCILRHMNSCRIFYYIQSITYKYSI